MKANEIVTTLKLINSNLISLSMAGKGSQKSGRRHEAPRGQILVCGSKFGWDEVKKNVRGETFAWQWPKADSNASVVTLVGSHGPIWVVRPQQMMKESAKPGHGGWLELSHYAAGRDAIGQALNSAMEMNLSHLDIDFLDCDDELIDGALVAIDLAAYRYKKLESWKAPFTLQVRNNGKAFSPSDTKSSSSVAAAVNLARHLVNVPPNILNPLSFADVIVGLSRSWRHTKVEVWNEKRIRSEGLNLLMAVGQASATPPRLVVIRYRHPKAKKAPIAVVGKGITFDTGGVNLKPDSGMRWMKKDMGGAATVAALAQWLGHSNLPVAVDFYLPLAENAIGGASFRPGDIFVTRSGQRVEIHNTDAEGRLVLADAIEVALKNKPQLLIDVATLTGAIKVGLGSGIAGLFGNDDEWMEDLCKSAKASGDFVWPMPLYRKYKSSLKSTAADMVNAGDGFGGAITAALFLESFVGDVPWLHLDIYAWKDAADGAIGEAGGSGQAVQALIHFMRRQAE